MVRVKFWGVRGSVPSPLKAGDVRDKIKQALINFKARKSDDIDEFLKIQLPHHDPVSSDEKIWGIERSVQTILGQQGVVTAAAEGMTIEFS